MNLSICSKRSKMISSAFTMPELEISLKLCEDSKNIITVKQLDQRVNVPWFCPIPRRGTLHKLNVISTDIKEDFGKVK